MKCQPVFWEKKIENISVCHQLKILLRMLSIKSQFYTYSYLRYLLLNGITFCNMS